MITKSERDRFFTGINYWGSKDAIHMWSRFDEASIEEDMKQLQGAGITHLRIFPLWPVFQPLKGYYNSGDHIYEYGFEEGHLPDTEAGKAGVSDEACQRLEKFCALAEKYNMKLIVGLITGQMSFGVFVPPALEGKCPITDPDAMIWELRFVKYMVKRLKHQPSIVAWDLGNEVNALGGRNVTPEKFHIWCSMIADAIRVCDSERPVISGLGSVGNIAQGLANYKAIGEICDINTIHPYQIFYTESDPLCSMKPLMDLAFGCRLSEGISGIPTFVQEYGSIGYLNCSYESEADFYRASLLSCLAHDCHGAMWWCAFDQGEMDYMPYSWNNIGSEYGFFDKKMQPKPIVRENLRFCELLRKLPKEGLPKSKRHGVVLVPRDDGSTNLEVLRASFMLAQKAGFNVDFTYALDPIPDAPLYILPSLDGHKAISKSRLKELLKKVEEGAVLYLSLGKALFRQMPELAGVDFASRRLEEKETVLSFHGEKLPVKTDAVFEIESVRAEVLAKDSEDTPVFFRNRYGKGAIYLFTIPLEKYLAKRQGAFYQKDMPRYDQIYREVAIAAGVKGMVESDSPFVCFTEHYGENGEIYVFAINYSHIKQCCRLTVKEGYHLLPVHGPMVEEGILELEKCDGALYLLRK